MVTTRIYTVLLAIMLLVALPTEVVPGNAMRTMRNTVRSLTGYPVDRDNNPWLQSFSQELLDAVRDGDLAVVQAMTFGRNKTYLAFLLTFATEYRCFSSIRYLIEHGAGFGTTSLSDRLLAFEDFITTLDGAIQSNDMATMQSLVVGASWGEKTVALQWASHHGYLAAVQCLVENGANIHAGQNDALALAAEQRHFAIARYLVSKGAFIGTLKLEQQEQIFSNLIGRLAAIIARGDGVVATETIITAASQAEKDVALRWALRINHQLLVRYLLDHGADIYIVSPELRKQIFADSIAQIDAVVHHNDDSVIDIALLSQAAKKTALSRAINNDDLAVVQYLVEQGETDIHSYDDWALRDAAHETRWVIARYLIQQGSNPANHLTEEQKESIARCGRKAAG